MQHGLFEQVGPSRTEASPVHIVNKVVAPHRTSPFACDRSYSLVPALAEIETRVGELTYHVLNEAHADQMGV